LAPGAGKRCNGIARVQKPMARIGETSEECGNGRNTTFRPF